ncbi:MAG: cytochrome C oxidase subunit III [Cryomorphaceae bacterium]|nr:MAG: cytochrome C oxidase subunit III [Cryomorphaceae bacterium]
MNNSALNKTLLIAALLALGTQPAFAQGGGGMDQDFLYGLLIGFGVLFLVIILVLNGAISGFASNKKLWKPRKKEKAAGVLAFMLLASSKTYALSPDASVVGIFSQFSTTFWLLLVFDLFLVVIIIVQLRVFAKMVETLKEKDKPEVEEEVVVVEQESLWMKKIMGLLTKSVPVEREAEVLTDHEYDGIKELDNVLPPWWVAMMYITIIFAVVYLVHYHVLGTGDLQSAEYYKSVEQAEAEIAAYMALAKAQVDESNVTIVDDASRLANGQKIYNDNCVACHGKYGEGGVGPNMADEYWIHGGSINDIFAVIKYGVPAKGMIAWRTQLSPTQIQDVASYLLTFQGTNPPNAKAPEGELYVPEEVEDDAEGENGEAEDAIPDEPDQEETNDLAESETEE